MANSFCCSGGIMYVTTTLGAVYEGQFLGLRYHDDAFSLQEIQYLYIKPEVPKNYIEDAVTP